MCDNNCSCGCHKVVVCCGGGGVTAPAPTPTPTPEPTPTTPEPQPQPTPSCTLARVDFVTLRVTDDAETGAGDWTLVLEANGIQEIKEYPDDFIDDDDGIPYDIGVSVNVPIDQFTTELRVKVSGYERDSGFNGENDILPIAQRAWSAAQNFGIGQTFDISANNDDAAYSVTVRISCARQSSLVLSRAQLVQAATWRLDREIQKLAKHKKPPVEITNARALNQSIRSMERKGWTLKTVSGDEFIFEGLGRVPSLRMEDPRRRGKGKVG